MKIVLVGCGKMGQALCRELAAENHEITVIDISRDKVTALVNEYDVMGLVGSGVDVSIVQEAETDKADLFLAMTHSDELNLLCCLLAKRFGDCTTIARVRKPEYDSLIPYLKDQLNLIKTINPDRIGAREIARVLRFPSAISVDIFSNGLAEILTFKVPEKSLLDGFQIKDIVPRLKSDVLVCAVQRKGKTFIPNGDFIIEANDKVSVAGNGSQTSGFFKKIGLNPKPIKNLMIVGGGLLTYYLTKELSHDPVNVTIISESQEDCEQLATAFPEAVVIHGEGCDEALLDEEGIIKMDAFAALSGIDEENIVLALYAKSLEKMKTIAKVDKIRFDQVLENLDLDTIINLKEISAESVLRYVRSLDLNAKSSVISISKLAGNEAEAIEWRITKPSEITRRTLMELSFKPEVLITRIIRDGKSILPRGNDKLQVGDLVVVVTTQKGLNDITDVLTGGRFR